MTREASKPATLWSRMFITLCIINLLQVIGQMMMVTIMPLYARDMGASAAVIGFVVGSFAVASLVTRPFATPAFDSFSKKKIFFFAIGMKAVCSFLYGFCTNVTMLILVRMLHGVAMGCSGPLALAIVSDVIPQERMGSGISIFSLAQALAQAVGPALGLWLVSAVGYQMTFRISGISIVFACILILTLDVKEPDVRPPYRLVLGRIFARGAIPPAVLTGIFSACNASVMSFIAIYASFYAIDQIGLYFTVHAICLLVTRPLFGRLADKLGFAKVMIPSIIAYACGFLLISQSHELWMFLVAAVIMACGYGVCSPLFQAIAMQSVPRSRRGAASSTNYTGLDAAQLAGPAAAGFVIEHFGAAGMPEVNAYSSMYLVVAGVVLAGLVVYIVLYRIIKRNMAAAKAENERAA